ncbi:hypothetical protein [Noviherbaspirillum malthae]|uniref:hypothetical protein n=1 Tax=Noviherbaspirillum malthae TaxID=1260987 RepID=UPI00188E18D7|nr:hypothetical protein [Noviherbaspirillum malthae]
MSRANDVTALLQQYAAETGVRSMQKVEQDFIDITHQMPSEAVTNGLAEALHSEHTPPFEEVVGVSLERGDASQRAGMLKPLLDAAGPVAAKPLIDQKWAAHAAAAAHDTSSPVESRLAGYLSTEAVERLACHAAQVDPAVVRRMSRLYAGDPELDKTLGGATLSVALGKLAGMR